MRLLLSSTILLAALTGAAHAADLPLKAPPPNSYGWTGGYGGIAGGYGWGHSSQTDPGIPQPPAQCDDCGVGDGHYSMG